MTKLQRAKSSISSKSLKLIPVDAPVAGAAAVPTEHTVSLSRAEDGGFGLQLCDKGEKGLKVKKAHKGSTAEAAHVGKGEYLRTVDGVSVEGMGRGEVAELIKAAGTTVVLGFDTSKVKPPPLARAKSSVMEVIDVVPGLHSVPGLHKTSSSLTNVAAATKTPAWAVPRGALAQGGPTALQLLINPEGGEVT